MQYLAIVGAMASRKSRRRNGAKKSTPHSIAPDEVATTTDGATPLWMYCIAGLLIFSAVVVAYWHTLGSEFITWDDRDYIYENPLLRGPLGAIWLDLFAKKPHEQFYPVVFSSFWLEYQFVQLDPLLYHATQIALHGINAVLILFLAQSLGAPFFASIVAASLFALHPINVASVAWVSERKNTLSELFSLLALLSYIRFRKRGGPRWYLCAIVAFTLALMSKSIALMLAPTIILTDYFLDRRFCSSSLRRAVPFFALGIVMMFITMGIEQKQALSADPPDFLVRIPIAARALVHYVSKLVIPMDLLPIYPRWSFQPAEVLRNPNYFLAVSTILAAAWMLRRYRQRIDPLVTWSLCSALLSLLPMLGFYYFNYLQHSFVADHFLYHSTVGIFLALGILCDTLLRGVSVPAHAALPDGMKPRRDVSIPRMLGAYAILSAVLVGCGILTTRHASVYRNGEAFWLYTLQGNPESAAGNINLGNHYFRKGDYETSLMYYQQAARILPTHVLTRRSCAQAAEKLGRIDDAVDYYRDAIQAADATHRVLLDIRFEFADFLLKHNFKKEARAEYTAIIARSPGNERAMRALQSIRDE